MLTLVCAQNKNISNDQVKVAAKNINTKFFAYELWVKRVGTFGVVLYRNQWPVNFILHFAELHIGSSDMKILWKLFSQMLYSQKNFNILHLFF